MRRMSDFEYYIRTGRVRTEPHPLETKFNPWHDPDDGRFTFAGQGRNYGGGMGAHVPHTARVRPTIRSRSGAATHVSSGQLKAVREAATVREPIVPDAARSSGASALKIAGGRLQAGQSRLVTVGHLKIVQFGPGVKLVPVAVASAEEFSAATAQGSAMFKLDAVITGPQFKLVKGIPNLQGQVVVNGRIFGNSARDLYYVATIEGADGIAHLTFGKGDPPSEDVAIGFGGAVPLLINGQNVAGYNKGWKPYLESFGTGKNIVAYNSQMNVAALFIQSDGAIGHSLQVVRAFIRAAGYDNAVMFDGSGSTSLRYLGKAVIGPELLREPLIPLGIGFKVR